jgi:hypothetical protein
LDHADSSRRPHRPQASSPASRYRRTAGPAGPRGAAVSWAAMKSASLTSAACAGWLEMTQPSGRFLPVPESGVGRVGQVEIGALPVPHLPAGVAGVRQDRGDGAQCPRRARAVRVPSRVRRGRARHPGIVQRAGDPGGTLPGQPLGEHPPNDRRRGRVGFEAVRAPAPRRVRLVRVRPGVGEPVPVRRPSAQVPALLPGLRGHRGADPDPGPGDLPLGGQPERAWSVHGPPWPLKTHRQHPASRRNRAAIARTEAPGGHGRTADHPPAARCHAEPADRHFPRTQLSTHRHT